MGHVLKNREILNLPQGDTPTVSLHAVISRQKTERASKGPRQDYVRADSSMKAIALENLTADRETYKITMAAKYYLPPSSN